MRIPTKREQQGEDRREVGPLGTQVFAEPDESGQTPLLTLEPGTEVEVKETNVGWIYIEGVGFAGWVRSGDVDPIKSERRSVHEIPMH